MALFRVSNERAQFDAAGNETSDQYGAGIRFTQGGNARVTTASPTNYNQGIPMSSTGQVAIVDATAGLPAGTIFHNGLPISGDKVCVSRNATAVVSNGLPFDSAGAVAADVNLDLNFIGTDTLNSSITFTRASTATYFNSAGTLTTAAINEARFDYNPATLAVRGLLIEEQRTNSIRNNTMQGAVAPFTFPTNWQNVIVAGLTATVVGTGAQNGITYLDVRVNGTPSISTFYNLVPDILVAGASGQTWTGSFWASLIAGSLSNTNANIEIRESDAAQGFLTNTLTALPITSVLTRYSQARTLTNASTAFVSVRFVFQVTSGLPVDFTLRIGLPQLEQGAFATSVIPTTTTALTRSADGASVNTLSPWYNASASTLYTEFNTPVPTTVTNSAIVAGYDDGTANNRFGNFYVSNTGAVSANQVTAGAANYTITGASGLTLSSVQKQATRFQAGSYASSVNGAAAVTDSFASAPPTVNTLRFGLRPSGTQANMWLRRVTVYPRGLTNAELVTLST